MRTVDKFTAKSICGIVVLALSDSCGTSVSGATEDGSADVVESSPDAAPTHGDAQADGVDSPLQTDSENVPWQQPTLRILARVVPTTSNMSVGTAPRPPFVADGMHGFERNAGGCNIRRMERWPRVDIGPIDVVYGLRRATTEFNANLGAAAVFENVSLTENTAVSVSGGGAALVGRFNLSARMPTTFRSIFPPSRPSDTSRPLPVPPDLVLQWVPQATPYLTLVEVTADEANDVIIRAYCRTSAASGEYRLPNELVDALQNATRVTVDIGLSDEVQMQVGAVPVLLTTFYDVATMGFR